jgi:CDP-diacylglycerol--glycerol-3-phosphate 3-phosphatidyltransferase
VNLPNLVTLSRVPVLFVVVGLLFAPWPGAATAAFVVFVAGGVTDWLDGFLARRYHMVSNFGKLMDALTDKVLIVGLLVALLVPLPNGPPLLPGWAVFAVLLILTREFLVTGLRLVAASQGRVLAAERSGKIKTVLQLVSIGALLLAHAAPVDFALAPRWCDPLQIAGETLFAAAAALTAASGVGYLIKYWDIFMGGGMEKPNDNKP